jgi:hypothetical protein
MSESINIDVSGLVPEARQTARQVAELFYRHTRPWFIGLVGFGSAVKGAVIPGASDIDFHLYLKDDIFVNPDALTLPLDLSLTIQRGLAQIDPSPFAYIDGGPERAVIPPGHVGPVPGAYHLIAGRLPVPEATSDSLKAEARAGLDRLDPIPGFLTEGLFHAGTSHGTLDLTVRRLAQVVWPVIFQVLALQQEDACAVWALPKDQAVLALAPDSPPGQAARAFYQAALTYYKAAGQERLDLAFIFIEQGVLFRQAAKDWWIKQ